MKLLPVNLVICLVGQQAKQQKFWDSSKVKHRALGQISKNWNDKCDAYSKNQSLKCVDQLELELRICLVRCDGEGKKPFEKHQ